MLWRVEVQDTEGIFDAVGNGVRKDIADLGIRGVEDVAFAQIYTIDGALSEQEAKRVCDDLLCDPVAQTYTLRPAGSAPLRQSGVGERVVEVAYNPGVMDPVEASTLKGIQELGIESARAVKTSKLYRITGILSERQFSTVCDKLLHNKLIQHIVSPAGDARRPAAGEYQFRLVSVPLCRASQKELRELSRRGQLFLNRSEMRAIQKQFRALKREPTDCELETIAQTWSEHCWHKTFRGKIDYTEKVGGKIRKRKIDNLLKSTIMKATRTLNKPWCVSVFHDNAGVIRFDDEHNVCFKVETHNHPSALEPYGGANTGIGGVIRDPMGTGLGARPVLNTDVFCFGPPDYPFTRLPPGALHPKRVMKGVVAGVRDYGNKMGIPTVNGAVLFHEGFVGNPLVYCGTAGILPKEKSFKKVSATDAIVVVGGRTGRDGIHGATFSSGELTHESETVSGGAVQIGDAIQEKKMLDAILQARDRNLYSAITDCGAGGLSSAVGEMGQDLGARVDLDKVPLKYTGLSYTEIWISESQERMVLSVPQKKVEALIGLFASEDVEAAVIGEFTSTGRLLLYYRGNLVCDLQMQFLHEGIPQVEKKALYVRPRHQEPHTAHPPDLTPALHALLRHPNICSKEWIVRQYDHEVQGGSVIKPLTGADNSGPSDASVVRPVLGSKRGIVVSNGINFRYGMIDPYWMAASCIDEAVRQIISTGGSLRELAVLDNFCWGNPDKADRLGSLVRAAYGCHDAAVAYGVPFISGKDSLYNEYAVRGKSVAIPGTLLISAIGVMEDVSHAVSMYAKKPGDLVYVVGQTYEELGGSHYYDILKAPLGNAVPQIRPKEARALFEALSEASSTGAVRALHDCSEGGIAVAAAEMAFAGGLGMDLFVREIPYGNRGKRDAGRGTGKDRNDYILFSESNSRIMAEVDPARKEAFERLLTQARVAFGLIGCVNRSGVFRVYGINGEPCIDASVQGLKKSWQETLAF